MPELSLEQFQQIFGMSPQEYKRKNPDKVKPAQGQTRLDNEKPYQLSDPNRMLIEGNKTAEREFVQEIEDPDMRQQLMDMLNQDERSLKATTAAQEQMTKNVASGILQIPSDVPAAVDLVRFGVPAVVRGLAGNDPNRAWYQRIGDAFVNSIFDEEAQQNVSQAIDNAQMKYRAEHPDASDEQVLAALQQYQDSEEFFDIITKNLPVGFSISQAGNKLANELVGLGKRPDEQTVIDEIEQVIGQSIVGLPRSLVNAVKDAAIKRVGARAVENIGTRAALRTAEVLTPATVPYTPANVALNAGVGAAIDEGMRHMQGAPTLAGEIEQYIPANLPTPEQAAIATGLTAGALLGVPGVRRAVQGEARRQTTAAVKELSTDAGPSLEEQGSRLQPQLNRMTGIADSNSPVKHAAQKFKAPDDTETVPQLDAIMSGASRTNRVEAENNLYNYGILEGFGETVPIAEIDRAIRLLDDEGRGRLDRYVYATQRMQDEVLQAKNVAEEMRDARMKLQLAEERGNRRDIKAENKRIAELQDKLNAVRNDDPERRPSMVDWSREDLQSILDEGNADPRVQKIVEAMKRVSNDLTSYLEKNGLISAEEAARRRRTRPLYVPLQERAYPNVKNPIARKALLFKDKFKTNVGGNEGFYIRNIARDVSGEGAKVNKPKTASIALREAAMDAVRGVTANNARRSVIDRLAALPNALGTLLRPYEFKIGNGKTTHSISEEQLHTVFGGTIPNRERYVKISRGGKVEFWEFSDPSITQSLKFAPHASLPILNETRKLYQVMTTGLGAPWFAAKTFIWDVPLAKVSAKEGRSLGLLDTYARRLFGESAAINALGDAVFDPTAFVSAGLAIPYAMGLRSARAVATKIASDLANSSGIFNAIAKAPGGKQFVENIGMAMAATFDKSAFHVMTRHLSTTLSHLNDASNILDDYATGAQRHQGFGRSLFNMYRATVESIQMSTKTAFFAENYGRLLAKHEGDIPDGELRKLVQETRNLTADMSRTSNSRFVQGLTSAVPYSNPIVQGTRHLLSATVPPSVAKGVNALGGNMLTDRTGKFWPQFITGVLVPKLGALAVLSQWDGAEDWWYNKVPFWQQMSVVPLPNSEALDYMLENGQWPEFDPEYVNMVPLSPEFGLVLAPAEAGMRAAGLIGPSQRTVPGDFVEDIVRAAGQITSFATPPLLQLYGAANDTRFDLHAGLYGGGFAQPIDNIPHGGANADRMTFNSDIDATVYNMVAAITSSAGQLVMQSLNVFDISLEHGNSFNEALDDALDTASFEAKRRLPAIDVPMLFDARRRSYAFTPESEYVYEAERALDPIIGAGRQMTVERDTSGAISRQSSMGLDTAQRIKDPNLLNLSMMIWDTLRKKGAYKEAREMYAEVRKDLAALEASRYKTADDSYNRLRNNLVQKEQELRRIQAQELQKLENFIKQRFGRKFMAQYGKPFSYETLGDLIRQDVAR